jgi:hypothetical protein
MWLGVRNGAGYLKFHIPWPKTTKEEGADIVLTAVPSTLNLVAAFRHHLAANRLVPDDAPLFAFEMLGGGWAPMTKSWFMERVAEVWKVAYHTCQTGTASESAARQSF